MKQYKIIKNFNESNAGDIIWLNDRRAKSELRNGNIAEIKEEKKSFKTKEEKIKPVAKRVTKKKVTK